MLIMDKMKRKKSAGPDGLTQERLLLGKEVMVIPLTHIINTSITSGTVPKDWKEATVIPILKKGLANEKSNYRPVSCLVTASKVLEKAVCNQITDYMESKLCNQLAPFN